MFSMAIEHTMLDPANTPQRLAMLPLRVGLALAQSLEPLVRSQPKVKWPNDVLVEDRKISGILIESQTVGSQKDGSQTVGSIGYAIIGIGINCTVEFDHRLEPPDAVWDEMNSFSFASASGLAISVRNVVRI
jgi:biotin-(acetyl-CoA carboxylase) ligase